MFVIHPFITGTVTRSFLNFSDSDAEALKSFGIFIFIFEVWQS